MPDLGNNVFDYLFKMTYEPCYVDNKNTIDGKKNHYSTIFSAISSANYNSLIKVNAGLYVEKIQLNIPNVKIQASQPTTNAIIANEQYPSIVVDLPRKEDKVTIESLKFAHACESSPNMIKNPNYEEWKENSYRGFKVANNINTNILILKGTVHLDECRLSLAAHKDISKLVPSIVVEKDGILVVNRCEFRGGVGTIGILVKGGKIIVKETSFKGGYVGVATVGKGENISFKGKNVSLFPTQRLLKSAGNSIACSQVQSSQQNSSVPTTKTTQLTTSQGCEVIIKNCIFNDCLEGIILNGPFKGIVENNLISECGENGMKILSGNQAKVINNEIRECGCGVILENCSPLLLKNSIIQNKRFGIESFSTHNVQCSAHIKFNRVCQNLKGAVLISGCKNKTELFNNTILYNNKVGVKVEKNSHPHILLNNIEKTLGNGVYIGVNSTAFVEKNTISDSLKCNLLIEGPNNIGNHIYNNKIQNARADGIFLINCERFLISQNTVSNNHNGILSITSVVDFQDNEISNNQKNGIMFVDDTDSQVIQNTFNSNKKAGVVVRESGKVNLKRNVFQNNQIQILLEKDNPQLPDSDAQKDNQFIANNRSKGLRNSKGLNSDDLMLSSLNQSVSEKVDIRVPKNYYNCEIM